MLYFINDFDILIKLEFITLYMPQLDILIFKFENFHFMISFFLFFFLNQYFVFPAIVKNVTLRRKLITRNLINENESFFFLSLVKNFHSNKMDSFLFVASVSDLRLILSNFSNSIFEISNNFVSLKQEKFENLFKQFSIKLGLVVFINDLIIENYQIV